MQTDLGSHMEGKNFAFRPLIFLYFRIYL